MVAVDERADGDKRFSRLQMEITDQSGRKRIRVASSKAMDFDAGTRQLTVFESPADVRGTALLTFDYDDANRDDDQWLFLPSLRKANRISSGNKSGSFMGSDFSYADMTSLGVEHYKFKLLKQDVVVADESCWLIESRPITDKARDETGYLKSLVWVSKEKLMPLQIKAWIPKGKKLKYMKFEKVEKIDGIWAARRLVARTVRGKDVVSTTVLGFSELRFNDPEVSDQDFTIRALERGM